MYNIRPFKTCVNLDFDPSKSFKVKCDAAVGIPMHGFYYSLIVMYGPIHSAPLRDISLRNRLDLEFDLNKVTQGQMLLHHWTPHVWSPVNV